MTLNIRIGDKAAILVGGYAHYWAKKKALIKGGMKEKEAHAKAIKSFERITVDTQQSPDTDQRSQLQRGNIWGRLLAQFMSSANALARAEYSAMVEFAKGRSTKPELAKAILIYHLIIPNLIQLSANLFRWDEDDQLRASLWGATNGIFLIGDVVQFLVNHFTEGEQRPLTLRHPLEVYADLIAAMDDMDDMTFEEIIDGMEAVEAATKAAGGISGIPINKMYRMLVGLSRIDSGDFEEGIWMGLGASGYALDKNLE